MGHARLVSQRVEGRHDQETTGGPQAIVVVCQTAVTPAFTGSAGNVVGAAASGAVVPAAPIGPTDGRSFRTISRRTRIDGNFILSTSPNISQRIR